jgi:N6-L-threonylcarbamoyladenine synthase
MQFGGVVPGDRRPRPCRTLDLAVEAALAEAGVALGPHRCDRRDGGAGADRRGPVRRHDGQGAGDGARQAADRGEPPGRSRPDAATDGRRAVSLPSASGLGRALPDPARRRTGTPSRALAAPSTTRRGRPSTRSRGFWACRSPGDPSVEAEARKGDPDRFAFPRPLLDRPGFDMSFSGLKTAVLRVRDGLVAGQGGLTAGDRADICAGFQAGRRRCAGREDRHGARGQPGHRACRGRRRRANATLRAGWTWWRPGPVCRFWRRRWRCAPTMRR